MPGQLWNAESDALLTKLWHEGMSCGQIALQMNATKNAVVGRAHRLKLAARPSPIRKATEAKPLKIKTGPRVKINKLRVTVIDRGSGDGPQPAENIARYEAHLQPSPQAMAAGTVPHGRCLFPLWTDATPKADRLMCAARVRRAEAVYCEAHRARAYLGAE